MSRKTWSDESEMTVPSSCNAPATGLCAWVRSNAERTWAKFSTGSLIGSRLFSGADCDSDAASWVIISSNLLFHARTRRLGRRKTLWKLRDLRVYTMRRERGRSAFVVNDIGNLALVVQSHGDHVVQSYPRRVRNLDGPRQHDVRPPKHAVDAQPPR